MQKAQEDELKVEKIKADIMEDSKILTDLNPKIEEFKGSIKKVEAKILESGGMEYKKMKDELEKAS